MITTPPSASTPPSGARGLAPAQHGEVFTRRWVVDLILDLCDYTTDRDLTEMTLLDPAVGSGAFLRAAVDRLLSAKAKHAEDAPWEALENAIVGVDIQPEHVATCRAMLIEQLTDEGCPSQTARLLVARWVRTADFLLSNFDNVTADVVVGNPPYIRIEDLSPQTLSAYRRACRTMGGRADVYVGFYERGLDVLRDGGRLGFICADRWMRNQYGRKLREKILAEGISVDTCLVMHDVDAFEDEVSAYPAITVLRRGKPCKPVVGDANARFDESAAVEFVSWARNAENKTIATRSVSAARLPHWHASADSWPDGSPETLAWLEELADRLPLLEDASTGTKVGIGVATGADAVYVTKNRDVVEPERLLPLAMAGDLKSGTYEWTGYYLVNPWNEDGLVDLADWPRLSRYLHEYDARLKQRSTAKNNHPSRWYRTIDRVAMPLTAKPKLLFEDLKARPNPVLEPGGRYPHHNLYYLVSDGWNLEALGGLLLSEVVERQIAAYCVKMRGKTLRFQAQYLRRVRVPHPNAVPGHVSLALAKAFSARDRDAATAAALEAYGIDRLPQ